MEHRRMKVKEVGHSQFGFKGLNPVKVSVHGPAKLGSTEAVYPCII